MIKDNKIQVEIGKWLSLYTLLLFICLPVLKVLKGFEDSGQVDFVELQENLESEVEIEDISDKNEFSEKEYKILQTLKIYSEKSVKAAIYISIPLYSSYSSEVQVPPPEC